MQIVDGILKKAMMLIIIAMGVIIMALSTILFGFIIYFIIGKNLITYIFGG